MTLTWGTASLREEAACQNSTDACTPQTSPTCTCGWSPWSGFRPGPAPPRQCKSAPISLERRNCSSDSPSHHPACTPLPCRGSGHLGMQKRATNKEWWNETQNNSQQIYSGSMVRLFPYLYHPGAVCKSHDVPFLPKESRVRPLDHLKLTE